MKHLHIISFNIPYPANYGGVIDVFYKLKALHAEGVKIYLHCFAYGRDETAILKQYCESVHYYKRNTGLKAALSMKPYIVSSRQSEKLMFNLLKDDHPILFEGLHSCFNLADKRLKNRFKIYRESNIEHHYYHNLFSIEKSLGKKLYFLIESIKLKKFQKILSHTDTMLAVSQADTDYLKAEFPQNDVKYLPSFHPNDKVECITGKGNYILYHGNLSVGENIHVAEFLVKNVFNDLEIPFVIAGLNPSPHLYKLIEGKQNVSIIANPDDAKMLELVQQAQVNILLTFQATGLKLKLLNTLYKGRFCLVNDKMLTGTGLEELCVLTGEDTSEIKKKLKELMGVPFTETDVEKRIEVLKDRYDNKTNAKKLIGLL